MIILGMILFSLLVIIVKVAIIVYIAPIVIGLFALVAGNIVRKSKQGKFAPVWWDILTVIITSLSTWMLWEDMANEAVDFGFDPFLILIIYTLSSICLLALLKAKKKHKKPPMDYNQLKKHSVVTPRKITNRNSKKH